MNFGLYLISISIAYILGILTGIYVILTRMEKAEAKEKELRRAKMCPDKLEIY